jgi:hypothetical protein
LRFSTSVSLTLMISTFSYRAALSSSRGISKVFSTNTRWWVGAGAGAGVGVGVGVGAGVGATH